MSEYNHYDNSTEEQDAEGCFHNSVEANRILAGEYAGAENLEADKKAAYICAIGAMTVSMICPLIVSPAQFPATPKGLISTAIFAAANLLFIYGGAELGLSFGKQIAVTEELDHTSPLQAFIQEAKANVSMIRKCVYGGAIVGACFGAPLSYYLTKNIVTPAIEKIFPTNMPQDKNHSIITMAKNNLLPDEKVTALKPAATFIQTIV